jgi:large subunit ribosomal protein L3
MEKALIGKKLGMTQVFDEKGNVVPVTVIEAGPCPVVFLKTQEIDGYEAVQLGFGDIRVKKVTKPMAGHFKRQGVAPKKTLREFKLEKDVKVGDILKADLFESGEKVDVVGTSKGKGTAGVVKRWHFSKLKESHGSGPVGRHGGSIGACSSPSRVYKGKKMAGRLGHERVTVQNLTVMKVDAEHNILAIKGAIPGPKGGIVLVSSSIKRSRKGA